MLCYTPDSMILKAASIFLLGVLLVAGLALAWAIIVWRRKGSVIDPTFTQGLAEDLHITEAQLREIQAQPVQRVSIWKLLSIRGIFRAIWYMVRHIFD